VKTEEWDVPRILDSGPFYRDANGDVQAFYDHRVGKSCLGLLDGYGIPLPPGSAPVYLEIAQEDLDDGSACNSCGTPFSPAVLRAADLPGFDRSPWGWARG